MQYVISTAIANVGGKHACLNLDEMFNVWLPGILYVTSLKEKKIDFENSFSDIQENSKINFSMSESWL